MNEYRVFGPPGTGKTTFISGQIARAVEARGPDRIMVASFTKAAAIELAGRDLPISPKNLGTLHALCYRELGSPTIAETKTREFNKWQSIYHLSEDSPVDIDEPEQKFDNDADRLMAQYQTYRARMIPRERWPVDVAAFARQWENWKRTENYIDFTDMIELTLQFQAPPPGRPSIGFFDEVQDFTLLELSLIRQWAEHMEYIVLAGDDDQCIYGFKGATPQAFLSPAIDEANKRILAHSWRMPSAIHEYSQKWVHLIGQREPKEFSPRESEGAVWHRPELRYRGAYRVVEEIAETAASGQKVMVIAACSYQIAPIVRELRNRGELFHNPYRRKRGDWNPLQSSRQGVTSTRDRLIAFSRPHHEIWGEEARPWTWSDLRKWTPLLRKTGAIQRGKSKLIDLGPQDEIVSASDLTEIFEPQAMMPLMKGDLQWVLNHAASDKERALEYPVQVVKKKGWRALLDTPRIVVGTIHSVKGGEADTVYIFPDLSPAGMTEYCDDSSRDGVMRQFYVGMTRAKENLVLCGQSSPHSVQWI